MPDLSAYLDDYGIITLISHKSLTLDDTFYLETPDHKEVLKIVSYHDEGNNHKYILSYEKELIITAKNYLINKDEKVLLKSGKIVRTHRFDSEFRYDKYDLGVTYNKKYTKVKVWSPVIKELELVYFKKTDEKKSKKRFTYFDNGIWEVTIEGDYDDYLYYLNVKRNKKFKKVLDPYAMASTANGKYNAIINPETLYKMKNRHSDFSGNIVDSIIYEADIRDLTSLTKRMYKREFLGLLGENSPLDHIAELGVTHVQFLPVMDFYGVNEKTKKGYNWGYNPTQYFVPEGSYSVDPDNPKSRINELRKVIDYMHKIGLCVTLDVVYNHVYDETTHPFNDLVPGYYYRYDKNGIKTQSTGLDNDIASERYMVRHLILQATKFLLEFYDADGFRFDLMGLLDIETMNQVYRLSKSIKPYAIIYGEGWNMDNMLNPVKRANMDNQDKMEVAHFNDYFRDNFNEFLITLRGDFEDMLIGSPNLFDKPSKSINYLSCHDGLSLYDRLTSHDSALSLSEQVRLSFAFILFSQGVPFIQGGDEFLRTKGYNSNSYNSGDSVNGFDYKLMARNKDLIRYVRELISLRKEHKIFRIDDNQKISETIRETALNYYLLDDSDKIYHVYFKVNNKKETLVFDNEVTYFFNGDMKTQSFHKDIEITSVGVHMFYEEKK